MEAEGFVTVAEGPSLDSSLWEPSPGGGLQAKKCDGCSKGDATADCMACSPLENVISFCDPCWDLSHRFGITQAHVKRMIEKAKVPCEGYRMGTEGCPTKGDAESFCNECNQRLCKECWLVIHSNGRRLAHKQPALESSSVVLEAAPVTSPSDLGPLARFANFNVKAAAVWVQGAYAKGKEKSATRVQGTGFFAQLGAPVNQADCRKQVCCAAARVQGGSCSAASDGAWRGRYFEVGRCHPWICC